MSNCKSLPIMMKAAEIFQQNNCEVERIEVSYLNALNEKSTDTRHSYAIEATLNIKWADFRFVTADLEIDFNDEFGLDTFIVESPSPSLLTVYILADYKETANE